MNSVITLLSDYGAGSPYTAAMMGTALSLLPQKQGSRNFAPYPPFDLVQGAFLLRSVYQNFPNGSCHIICIDTSIALHKQVLIAEVNQHYFIAADNGIFSLLFDPKPTKVYKVLESEYNKQDLFPEKNVFLPVIAKLLKKGDLRGLAEPGEIHTEKQGIQPLIEENGIKGIVMLIDGYGNALTNIHRTLFEKTAAGRPFKLFYWNKQYIDRISKHFHAGKAGDDVLLYNENDFLCVAIYRGKGAQLLGLKQNSRIVVEFEEQPKD